MPHGKQQSAIEDSLCPQNERFKGTVPNYRFLTFSHSLFLSLYLSLHFTLLELLTLILQFTQSSRSG